MIQIGKILKKVPFFRMLGNESINFIVDRLKFGTFEEKQVLFKAGDPGDIMYIIISGKVEIRISNEDGGAEQVVATLGSGDYFGEMALLSGETRSASVVAIEPCEMFLLHKNDFDVILEKYPSISLSMGKIVSKRLRETLKKASQLPHKAEKIEATKDGPSGSLKDVSLVDLISFCEANSLTGSMSIRNGDQKGKFEFESGQLMSVELGDTKDDSALDAMLAWEDGVFQISVRPLTLKKEGKGKEEEDEVKSILIVNNSLVVRKVIERAFKGLGYDVNTAADIAKAKEKIDSKDIHIVISDIKLSDGNGLDFISSVNDQSKISFIFKTDDSIKPDFERKLKEYINAEQTKTHEVSEIVKLVENVI